LIETLPQTSAKSVHRGRIQKEIAMPDRARIVAAALFALLFMPATTDAQAPDAARMASAKELMQVAGVAKQFDEVMPMLTNQLAQSFSSVAPEKADEIREVFSQLAVKFVDRKGELIDQIAGLYAAKLGVDELAALIAFYKSPAGMKFIAVQPEIVRESIMAGHRWGTQLGREIEDEARRELKKRGVPL
jgi:uncharacterized protein